MNESKNTEDDVKTLSRHPIQVVSRRTGLSSDVIRVWERRYNAVVPERQQTGRRVYSDADVQRLSLLQQVTNAGRRISEVAELDMLSLQMLVDEDKKNEPVLQEQARSKNTVTDHVEQAFTAISQMNAPQLHLILVTAASELPQQIFLEQVVSVLLRKVGYAWEQGLLRIGHEHMASAVVRRLLSGMLGRGQSSGPLIVVTTIAGQTHEMGALMAAIAAESEGWRALYLGADMPAEEIVASVKQTKAQAVALSLQFRCDQSMLAKELQKLRLALPCEVKIIIGGSVVGFYAELLADIDALIPANLTEFRNLLN